MTRVAMKTAPFASEFRAVDFFCGAGGMTHGLRSAGIHVLGGIDNALQCKDSYERNNFPARFIHHDIASLRFEELSELLGIAVKDSQLIFVGCSPCQYWQNSNLSHQKRSNRFFAQGISTVR